MNSIKKNFNKILDEKRLTRKHVEDKCGMTQPELSRILNENRDPRLSTIHKIALGLGVESWQLFVEEKLNEVGPLSDEEKSLIIEFRKIPANDKRKVIKDTIKAFSN